MKCRRVFSTLKREGGVKCLATLCGADFPNRAGLFADYSTQLCRYSSGHLHPTVLMPQAIYIYLHAITAILVLLIKTRNCCCQWGHTPELCLGSFENLCLH